MTAPDREGETAPRHGEAVAVAPGVRRVTCANPSPMTHMGTQSYLVGTGREIALVDPGPDDPAHARALLAALAPGSRVTAILVTHSHRDHSAGARALAAETGAPVMAFGPHGAGMSEGMRGLAAREGADLGGGEGADAAFAPDVALADGETVAGEGWRIEALHTPGHLSNHLSFLLHGADGAPLAVFTGDTVMGWATTLVSPPEGDMRQLMASLRLLAALGAPVFLPGHGAPVTDPAAHVARQAAHRVARRDAIRAALAEGPATPAELTRRIYTDVDPAMWPAAERNVLATLIWLAEEGLARAEGPVGRAARFAAA